MGLAGSHGHQLAINLIEASFTKEVAGSFFWPGLFAGLTPHGKTKISQAANLLQLLWGRTDFMVCPGKS